MKEMLSFLCEYKYEMSVAVYGIIAFAFVLTLVIAIEENDMYKQAVLYKVNDWLYIAMIGYPLMYIAINVISRI